MTNASALSEKKPPLGNTGWDIHNPGKMLTATSAMVSIISVPLDWARVNVCIWKFRWYRLCGYSVKYVTAYSEVIHPKLRKFVIEEWLAVSSS